MLHFGHCVLMVMLVVLGFWQTKPRWNVRLNPTSFVIVTQCIITCLLSESKICPWANSYGSFPWGYSIKLRFVVCLGYTPVVPLPSECYSFQILQHYPCPRGCFPDSYPSYLLIDFWWMAFSIQNFLQFVLGLFCLLFGLYQICSNKCKDLPEDKGIYVEMFQMHTGRLHSTNYVN